MVITGSGDKKYIYICMYMYYIRQYVVVAHVMKNLLIICIIITVNRLGFSNSFDSSTF